MIARRVFLACVIVAVTATAAWTEESVDIGKLKVRADSPLARGEYPRLIITRAQLPAIRARMKHPEMQTYLKQAEDLIRIGKADALLLAALYQVTGEKEYAETAKKRLGDPSWNPAWTFTFDMLAETMTDAERKDYARRILARVKANRWRPRLLHVLAAWGNGLDEELTPYLQTAHPGEVVRTLANCNRWTRGRGGSSMGHGYNGEHFYSVEFSNMVGWSNATGEDLVSKSDFARQQPAWYVYHYLPWQKSREVIRVGVTMDVASSHTILPRNAQGESTVMLAVTQAKDGLGQWWHREYMGNSPVPHWRKGEEHLYGLAGRLLWLDPSIPSIPPERFPETRLFPENGHVVMRTDWTEDATIALFRCGRFGEIDGRWGRNNADNLHFIIYRDGYLAPDTGCVHTGNEYHWKMVLGANMYSYARQTIAHNSITVGRERIEHRGWGNRLEGVCLRGGQTTIQEQSWFKAWGLKQEEAQHGFKEGEITAYSTSPEFDYACGDATHSYPPSRVKAITRQFVYLKPDLFVVFDRVRPAKPDLDVIWNLHALTAPKWNGKSDPAPQPPKQFIASPDGKKVPNPHPGGHVLHTQGDTFNVTNPQGTFMDVQVLLPEEDARLVRTIGGPWHDFEVNGVNHGPTEETYKLLASRKGRDPLMGVGGWRIEVTPKRPADEVHFLHVLRVGTPEAGEKTPLETTLLKEPGRTGVKIRLGAKEAEVTFNTAGETGGRLVLAGRGEDLVTRIEDNYDRWKDDPRYPEWQTNEYMRAVIFPYGRKPQ